jgi:hypothetical protein
MSAIPAGQDRRRLYILLALLAVASIALYYQWTGSESSAPPVTTARSQVNPVEKLLNETPNGKPAQKPGSTAPVPGGQVPEALKLDQIENKVPDEPEAERNLFRFGQPPPPPAPPPPVYVAPPPQPVGPPPPPPIPPIPLKYTGYYKDPSSGRNIAFLVDKSGTSFQAVEGQVVDGRYKLHRITPTSVEMSYLDGTGRRTIPMGG